MQSESTNPPASRYVWADYIRGIGILLVVLGHVSGIPLQRYAEVHPVNWDTANIFNIIARSCVPLLFMISGALLLPRQEGLLDFYRKRFQRVLLPFIFWSLLYLFWKQGCFSFGSFAEWRQACYGEYSLISSVKVIFMSLVTRPAEYHLWFMYELFGIYLLTPVFRVLVGVENNKYLWYLIAVWFLFGPLQQVVEARLKFEMIFELGYLTGYIGYFILGYLLTQVRITKPMIIVSAVVYVLMSFYTVYNTALASDLAGRMVDKYQDLLTWNIILLSTSLFIMLRAYAERLFSTPRPKLTRLASRLTEASFGIYLVHVFVINWLMPRPIRISPLLSPAFLWIPISTLAVFFISWAIIAVLLKIPYLRSLVA